jgi:hypothetical protein
MSSLDYPVCADEDRPVPDRKIGHLADVLTRLS